MRDVRVEENRLVVTWMGEARARPDAVDIVLSIAANGQGAEEALADNADQLENLLRHLASAGIPRREVTVAGPTVGTLTSPLLDPSGKSPNGFTVRTYVRLRETFDPDEAARAIQKVATVLDAATRAKARLAGHGAEAVGLGLSGGGEVVFVLRDSSAARADAIAQGILASRPLAEAAAAAAGGRLGSLTGLHVAAPAMEQFQQATRMKEFPVDPNESRSSLINEVVVRAAVTVTFQFER